MKSIFSGNDLSEAYSICIPSKRLLFPLFVAVLALPVLQLLAPLYWGFAVDGLSSKDEKTVMTYTLLALATVGSCILLQWVIETERFKKIGHDIGLAVSLKVIEKLSGLSLGQVSVNVGERRTVIYAGIYAMITSIGRIFEVIPIVVIILITVAYLFQKSVPLGSIAAALIAVYITTSLWIHKKVYPKAEKYRKHEARVEERFFEKLANMPLVIRTDQTARALKDYALEHDRYAAEGRAIYLPFYGNIALVRDPIALACLACLSFVSIRSYFAGEMTTGDFIAVIVLADTIFSRLTSIGRMQQEFMQEKAKISAFVDILKTPRETPLPAIPKRITSLGQTIRFDNVQFRALNNVSCTIEPGLFTVVLGGSGAGKSTFLSALQGGYKIGGRIIVGDSDIESLDLTVWRRSIGYVEQNPLYWNDSVEYNILYGLNERADKIPQRDLRSVMVKAQLGGFFDKLNKSIGEGGSGISGGERQRVAIARALIGSPYMLIFDEAMSGLDVENETRLIAMILELVKETDMNGLRKFTVVAATHNLEMAEKADRIIMLEKGRVVGAGTKEFLSNTCEAYNRLVTIGRMNSLASN